VTLVSLAFLAMPAAVVVPGTDSAGLSGKWHIERRAAGRESRQDCTFIQKGSDLRGSCSSDRSTVEIRGKVDGKKVTWTYKSESEGGPVTVVYKGTRDSAAKITGAVSAVEFGIDGEFTAIQSN